MKHALPEFFPIRSFVLTLFLCASFFSAGAAAQSGYRAHADIPRTIDPAQKYLFYMHGAWIERHGLDRAHPQYGLYEYENIVTAFERKGFVVISEARLHEVIPPEYAKTVAAEVRRLIAQGVPPGHITVIGHSKGGQMALIIASILKEPDLNFVIMAGCGKEGAMFRRSFEKFLRRFAGQLEGRILSLYDAADREAATCKEAFALAEKVRAEEIVLHTGKGHGLFYSPRPVWIDQICAWAGLTNK